MASPLVGTTSPGAAPGEGWLRRVLIVVALAQICVTIDYWALSVALPPWPAAPTAKAGAASGIVLTGLLIAAALAVTLTASLVEEFQKDTGPAAENHAIDLVLRIAAALSGGAALLLLIAHPAEAKSSGR